MTRFVTKEGLKKLEEELEYRKIELRQEIAIAIKEAKEQGDLSENAEYSEAKRQQNENETRIAELEAQVKESEVVEHNKDAFVIQLGSKVQLNLDGKEMEFQIVGSNEANPANFKISNESPMGKALMDKKKGAKVNVDTPSGKITYAIMDVK